MATQPVDAVAVRRRTLALVVISTGTPRSLLSSLHSWRGSGLLDMVDDRVLWLNKPTDSDVAMGTHFGFRVLTPVSVNPRCDCHRPALP